MVTRVNSRRSGDSRKYEVQADLENVQLARAMAALALMIYKRGEKFGELQVGRGSLFWWGALRKNKKRIDWGNLPS
jgi:hypothetical protein